MPRRKRATPRASTKPDAAPGASTREKPNVGHKPKKAASSVPCARAPVSKSKRRRRRKRDPREATAQFSGDVDGRSVSALGTKWAPVDIPWRRRLQTFAVLVALTMLPMTQMVLITLFFLPQLRPFYSRELVIGFLLWTYVWDRKTSVSGGRPVRWLRNLPLWQYLREYYPAELIVTEPLDPERLHLFGLHPHGIIGAGMVANLIANGDIAEKALGGRDYRVLTVTFNFLVPLWRDFIMGMRFVSASRESAHAVLNAGLNCMIVVGGAREALDARPGVVDLTLNCRHGFVRIAMQHGAKLVPVFTFGENDLWSQVPNPDGSMLRRVQMLFRKVTGFTPPMIFGRGVFQYRFGILPHRRAVTTVVGPALEVKKVANPTKEQIKAVQQQYIKSLEQLYEAHKGKYDHPRDHTGQPIPSKGFRVVA